MTDRPAGASPPAAPIPEPLDGRHARSARTRTAICRALFDLIEQGVPSPTAQQIADGAGVALRSIRQHFDTRESLFLAAAALYAPRLERARDAVDPAASRAERITGLARRRADELSATAALRRAVQHLQADSVSVAAAARQLARDRRREIERAFAVELEALGGAVQKQLLDRLDLLGGGRLWDGLTVDLGLSTRQATAQLEALFTACLAAAPVDG